MPRKQNDGIAVVCPTDGHGDKGYDGMPCPECGTPMVPDTGFVDTEQALVARSGGESLEEQSVRGSLEDAEEDPFRMEQSLEEMAHDELEKDDSGEDHY